MINCDECKEGIKAAIDQLLSDEFINGIMDALSGEGFCGMEEDPVMCKDVIHDLIPLAMNALAGVFADGQVFNEFICNTAITDTCPAY